MGKKKRSKFVQQQNYNRHLQNKTQSNMNHHINRTNKQITAYQEKYEKDVNDMVTEFMEEQGLDPNTVPKNSRILIYELLRKSITEKMNIYTKYIEEHSTDENIQEYHDAKSLCKDTLEQIDWIYDWTKPLESSKYDLGEGYEINLVESASEKLEKSEKAFDTIKDILDIIKTVDSSIKDSIGYDFHRFCKFIKIEDLDKYYVYISNTIKNLKLINSEDPIKDFMLKPYKNSTIEYDKESE